LHILKWLRAQHPPCPWTSSACKYAIEDDNFEILRWLRTQRPPCPHPLHIFDSDEDEEDFDGEDEFDLIDEDLLGD